MARLVPGCILATPSRPRRDLTPSDRWHSNMAGGWIRTECVDTRSCICVRAPLGAPQDSLPSALHCQHQQNPEHTMATTPQPHHLNASTCLNTLNSFPHPPAPQPEAKPSTAGCGCACAAVQKATSQCAVAGLGRVRMSAVNVSWDHADRASTSLSFAQLRASCWTPDCAARLHRHHPACRGKKWVLV